MRILLQSRPELFWHGGGEAQQILRLREELLRREIHAEVSTDSAPNLDGCDLVHLFNITHPSATLVQALHAREQGKPILLSPVYQDLGEYNRKGRYGLAHLAYRMVRDQRSVERIKDWMRVALHPASWSAYGRVRHWNIDEQRKRVLELAEGLVTNSHSEMEALRRDYGARQRYTVATYAVHPIFFEARPESFYERSGLRDFVVCAGFISSLKNQLRLIRALRHTGLTLVVVGPKVNTHRYYYYRVRYEAARRDPCVILLGRMSQQELASVFAAAKVVVLPSWFETCGMACLEGAAAGANAVITNRGYTREYFRDFAWYCDPSDVSSIRTAVLSAYEAPRRTEFADYIRRHYTWEKAAESTLDLYQEVLRTSVASKGIPMSAR